MPPGTQHLGISRGVARRHDRGTPVVGIKQRLAANLVKGAPPGTATMGIKARGAERRGRGIPTVGIKPVLAANSVKRCAASIG